MLNNAVDDQASSVDPLFQGLARNPAAPLNVLSGLLRAVPSAACQGLRNRRDLARPVQDVMVDHSARVVRCTLAEHPDVDPEIRGRLLSDPDWWVVVRAFGSLEQQAVSDDVLTALLTRIEDSPLEPESLVTIPELYGELVTAPRFDGRVYRLAAMHPDPRVRRHAAAVPQLLDDLSREALMTDPDPEIRAVIDAAIAEDQRLMRPEDLPDHHCHAFWAVLNRPLSRALVDQVVASGDESALYFVGPNPSTPPDVVQALLHHPATEVRCRLAERVDLSHEQLLELAADPAVEVRTAVSVHPGLTEQERAGIDIDTTINSYCSARRPCRCGTPGFARRRAPTLADASRWARSVNPLLRRRAACNPELPTDLVTLLADDPNLGVRVLLAWHHPDAPPALLLRCLLQDQICGREHLPELPGFSTAGLAAFADHPDPVVRQLVALDPHAAPEIVQRLCSDPDLAVRRAMAACPRLPAARIIALLDDPDLAEYAAANPALPVGRMHRILASARSHEA